MKKDLLLDLRKEIDEVDEKLINLFQKRLDIVQNIGNYKKQNNIPIYNAEREKEIFDLLDRESKECYNEYTKKFMEFLLFISKECQKNV